MYIPHILNPSTCWFQAGHPKKTCGLASPSRKAHLRDIGHRAFIGMETELTRNGRCWIYLDIPWWLVSHIWRFPTMAVYDIINRKTYGLGYPYFGKPPFFQADWRFVWLVAWHLHSYAISLDVWFSQRFSFAQSALCEQLCCACKNQAQLTTGHVGLTKDRAILGTNSGRIYGLISFHIGVF